jgi:SAM-dependent methyltransferase
MFLNPRPTLDTIADFYPDSYGPYRAAIDDERWGIMRWKRRYNLRKFIQAVEKRQPRGRLLDVGCAMGNFLHEMEQRGWQVQGVELQASAAMYARQRFGLEVYNGDLLEYDMSSNHFDAITFWDVLEHTHDPLAILQTAYRLLKPDGLLVFSIPDPKSREASRFGPAWIGYDAPRHLYLFSDKSLRLLLERSGFSLVGTEHSLANYHSWVASWQTQVNRRFKPGHWRRFIVELAYLPIWAPLTGPYFRYLNITGKGTVSTVFARPMEGR